MRRLCLAVAVLVALAPGAAAGTQADPEVTDAAGDTQMLGLPLPAGFGWADVRAAWLGHADGILQLTIQVAGGPPPQGEVGVTFRVGDRHYIAGYTVVPGVYSGGFLSPSDADGDVPASASPASMPGEWVGDLIQVTFPAEEIGAGANATTVLAEPWAWAESRASNGEIYRVDRSEKGRDFSFGPAAEPTTGPSPTSKPSPGAGAPLLLATLVAAGVALRRR